MLDLVVFVALFNSIPYLDYQCIFWLSVTLEAHPFSSWWCKDNVEFAAGLTTFW